MELPKSLRPYQTRMVGEVGRRNVIVKMPTGSGKTLVAAECMRLALLRCGDSESRRAVFLVPARDLVEQQARAVRGWCSELRVDEYMSTLAVPAAFDVLVSTPEAFRRLQMRDTRFAWPRFSIIVFDEVHHVLKDHPYRKLAQGLRRRGGGVQVLGLSASLTYAVGEVAVSRSLQRLSDDLGLDAMATVDDDELRAGG
jgi:ERCC4-related helicase